MFEVASTCIVIERALSLPGVCKVRVLVVRSIALVRIISIDTFTYLDRSAASSKDDGDAQSSPVLGSCVCRGGLFMVGAVSELPRPISRAKIALKG